MYNPILGEYVNVPSTVGYHASTPVGAVPCSTNLYLNFADNPTYGTTWNTTHLIPRDCGGAAPHLAAWLDYQNMHTPTSVVLEYASGYLSYVVF